MKNTFSEALFNKMPVVGIIRSIPIDVVQDVVPYYKKAGFTTLEITMNSENAEKIIYSLSKNHPDMNIGAGTVCTIDDLKSAIKAGASFIVTPFLDTEVMQYCVENEIPIFPGALTPLEINNASKFGAMAVKVFPATQLGPGYIKDILAPLNTAKLLPTGGVTIDNIADFFKAGAIGVGMGGSLFDKKLISSSDFSGLLSHFKAIALKVSNVI